MASKFHKESTLRNAVNSLIRSFPDNKSDQQSYIEALLYVGGKMLLSLAGEEYRNDFVGCMLKDREGLSLKKEKLQ